jgi:hypothetical protein
LKLLSQHLAGDTLVLDLEGLAGRTYRFRVRTPSGVQMVETQMPDSGSRVDGYAARSIRVTATN